MKRLDDQETVLLRGDSLDRGKILELINDLREELEDYWNIIAFHEGRQ